MRKGVVLKRGMAGILCLILIIGGIWQENFWEKGSLAYADTRQDQTQGQLNEERKVSAKKEKTQSKKEKERILMAATSQQWKTQLQNKEAPANAALNQFTANFFKYEADTYKEVTYNRGINKLASDQAKSTNQTPLYFTRGECDKQESANHYSGVWQGLADSKLEGGKDGRIQFSKYAVPNLFYGKEGDGAVRTAYRNVKLPLTKDAQGYYEYDSDQREILPLSSSGQMAVLGNSASPGKPGFWPFGMANRKNGEGYTGFGMEFAMEFYTTPDGKLSNQDDMEFSFTGDDDVWVFIDGKLVIDLGGIHPKAGANINLSTGNVEYVYTYNSSNPKSMANQVYATQESPDYNIYDGNTRPPVTFEKEQFLDGKVHTLRMFYLERGAYDSNCKLKFNLPQEPQDGGISISNTVKKIWVDGDSKEETELEDTDTEFVYEITKDGVPVKAYKNTEHSTDHYAEYILVSEEEEQLHTPLAVTDGRIILKSGQSAVFLNLGNGRYRVVQKKETDGAKKYPDEYSSCTATYEQFLSDGSTEAGTPKKSWSDLQLGENQLGKELVIDCKQGERQKGKLDFENKRYAQGKLYVKKQAYVNQWENRLYKIKLQVGQSIKEPEFLDAQSETGVVSDYIDPRFQLAAKDGTLLTDGMYLTLDGEKAEKNENETQGKVHIEGTKTWVEWKNAKIPAKIGEEETYSWKASFYIKARKEYAGGNCIETNTDLSGVQMLDQRARSFAIPKVNVRTDWKCANAQDTIFLGEDLTEYFDTATQNTVCGSGTYTNLQDLKDKKVTMQWFGPDGKIIESDPAAYIRSQKPKEDVSYQVKVIVAPKIADDSKEAEQTAKEMRETDSVGYYTASTRGSDDAEKRTSVIVTGQYRVRVVKGELTIRKRFDQAYLRNISYTTEEKKAVKANQSAIFRITRYAETDADCTTPLETYQTVLSYDTQKETDGFSQIKLIGLCKGYYKVEEQTDWSWKYKNTSVQDSYETAEDGIFFIGKKGTYQELDEFFGQQGAVKKAKAEISFENELKQEKKWLGDTTHKNNVFQ
ncbi:MAG: fibro-slime domain-containing protein [Lachnospiraceae bacterium]